MAETRDEVEITGNGREQGGKMTQNPKQNIRISVASRKGGTGKTTVATSLAAILGSRAQLLDCSVEYPITLQARDTLPKVSANFRRPNLFLMIFCSVVI
jgi:Mrp family chromosome partitioning ATPase